MTSKYDGLANHLVTLGAATITLTFAEIEAIVGPLPETARRSVEWWGVTASGRYSNAHLSFIACWNNFTFPLLLGARETQTITLATITFIGSEQVAWGMMTAAAMVTIIPELLLAIIVQKYIVRGLTYGSVKG